MKYDVIRNELANIQRERDALREDVARLKEELSVATEGNWTQTEVEAGKWRGHALHEKLYGNLEAQNKVLRNVVDAAKLLKTDPDNDAYRFNLWQALKEVEG